MKNIAVVAGGNLSESYLEKITSHDQIIGADRGAWWLLTYKIIPDFAVGDFDSVSPEELEIIKQTSPNVVQYDKEKDETDLEIAINLAISLNPGTISVFGGTGSRLDQTLAGIYLLEKLHTIDITFYDESNEISIVTNEKSAEIPSFPLLFLPPYYPKSYRYPLGFKYPLTKGLLERNKTLGISNEILHKEGKITVHNGKVLCIQSKE